MKVYYDREADALYIELGEGQPDGAVEISEGVSVDTTQEDAILGIEILQASKKLDLQTILSYSLEVDKRLLQR